MLLAYPPELDARLRRDFAGMDIKDLIKTETYSTKHLTDFFQNEYLSGPRNRSPNPAASTVPGFHPSIGETSPRTFPAAESPNAIFSRAEAVLPEDVKPQTHTTQSQYRPGHAPANLASGPVSQRQESYEWPRYLIPNKRGSPPDEGEEGPPAKKSSTKWNPEENRQIIKLRGQGMKWSDISRHIPGRTGLACRLHYQNYLEKRGEWDEEKKNKLARVYER